MALNNLIPELTRHAIAKIFATEPEDWQATLRAMEETGEEFRQGKIVVLPAAKGTATALEQAPREATVQ